MLNFLFFSFLELSEIIHAWFLAQGLTHNAFSKYICLSALNYASFSPLLFILTFLPWEIEFCYLDVANRRVRQDIKGWGKKGRGIISPALSLLDVTFGISCSLLPMTKAPSHGLPPRSKVHNQATSLNLGLGMAFLASANYPWLVIHYLWPFFFRCLSTKSLYLTFFS